MIDVNVKGVANVIRHFVPAMLKRKTGVIVNKTPLVVIGHPAGAATPGEFVF